MHSCRSSGQHATCPSYIDFGADALGYGPHMDAMVIAELNKRWFVLAPVCDNDCDSMCNDLVINDGVQWAIVVFKLAEAHTNVAEVMRGEWGQLMDAEMWTGQAPQHE